MRAEKDDASICIKLGNIYGFDGGNYAGNVYDKGGLCPTLRSHQGGNQEPMITEQYAIRKLTPREMWRLMSFTDEDFEKAEAVVSNTQLIKQAGNSIVCKVLEAIFGRLLEDNT